MKEGMKGSSLTWGAAGRDAEAWVSMGTFKGFQAVHRGLHPEDRARWGREEDCRGMRLTNTGDSLRRGFSATLRSVSFILKVMVAPEGLPTSV